MAKLKAQPHWRAIMGHPSIDSCHIGVFVMSRDFWPHMRRVAPEAVEVPAVQMTTLQNLSGL
jgi:hypothetical protein